MPLPGNTREPKTKRILVADPIGDGGRAVVYAASDLGAEVTLFEQAAALAVEASRSSADLIVLFRPESLVPLERLRNDPRTRHIPVLLVARTEDPDQRLFALGGADHIVDYPFEAAILFAWLKSALDPRGHRPGAEEFAEAKPRLEGRANWLGRINWASRNSLRFECDVALTEGTSVPLVGPLVSALGLASLDARVANRSREDVFYGHEYRYHLEIDKSVRIASISRIVAADTHAVAPRKRKVAVVATDRAALRKLSDAIDNSRFALRWIPTLEGVGPALRHITPVLIVVDPATEGLDEPMQSGGLLRAAKQGIPLLPLAPPAKCLFWDRAAQIGSRLDVPGLDVRGEWNALIEAAAAPPPPKEDPDRVYIRRDHPYSHGRVVLPCLLSTLTEASGLVDLDHGLATGARARLDLPGLAAAGVRPLHGRALRETRKGEPARLVWMGIGDGAEAKALRFFIHETIMAKRRKEFETIPPAPVTPEEETGEA